MAAPDVDQASVPKKKGGLPLWILIGGGGLIAYVLYRRMRSSTTASTQQPLVPAVTTDPNTGMPIDPLTGLPYTGVGSSSGTQNMSSWIAQAESWARQHHLNAGLVSQALYDYTNGNKLTEKEANVVTQILTAIGYPPELLPWRGPQTPNPTTPKGPFFNWQTWKFWGLTPAEAKVEPKFLPKGSNIITVIGKIGGQILMPLANAPIYALVPRNWTATGKPDPGSGASGANTGPLTWRRIDNNIAYSLLPTGTQIATYTTYAPAAA